MSYSLDVKNELAVGVPERECCRRALLASLLLADGCLENDAWMAYCAMPAVVRLILRLARTFDGPPMTWEQRSVRQFGDRKAYVVKLGPAPRLRAFLARLGIHLHEGPTDGGYEYGTALKRCCQRAFIRGSFLMSGSVSHPTRNYHLEWTTRTEHYATILLDISRALGLPVAELGRRYHRSLYLKSSTHIAQVLTLMGATQALLRFEEVRSVKETKNQVHRRVNCETANLNRLTAAAVAQVADIEFLERTVGWRALPPALRGIARARLRAPEASYDELGRLLKPTLSKGTVGRRLQSLSRLARRLRDDVSLVERSRD